MRTVLSFLFSLLDGEAGQTIRRARRNAVLGAILAAFLFIAVLSGAMALFFWLEPTYGAVLAALSISAISLVIVGVILVVMKVLERRARRRVAKERAARLTSASLIAGSGLLASPRTFTAVLPVALAAWYLLRPGDTDSGDNEA